MLAKRNIEFAIYALFIAAMLCAPLLVGDFWLNRIAKYLVYGMLGIAMAISWGYAGILNLGQGCFFGSRPTLLRIPSSFPAPPNLHQGPPNPVPTSILGMPHPGRPPHPARSPKQRVSD